MDRRLLAAFAVVVAVAFMAVGYAVGTSHQGVDRATVEEMVKDMMAAAKPAPAASPVPAASSSQTQTAELSDDERADIEAIIRNYLIANPEIVRDAINELQRREDEAARQAQVAAIGDNAKMIFDSPNEAVIGNPKGDVTLVEFFDYNCAYCRRAQADMKALIASDPNLRVVLKEFPILSEGSLSAAQVSMAILMTQPDKYLAFHDALIDEKGQVDGTKALAVAADLGVDMKEVKAKMDSDEVKAALIESHDLATKLDVTGTPSYVTKLKVVVGAVGLDALKAEIKAARDCADVASC